MYNTIIDKMTTKQSLKVIFNKHDIKLDKKPKLIQLRIVNDDNFSIFCTKLNLNEDDYKRKSEIPLEKDEKINIPNYNGLDYNFIMDKWYNLQLIFATNDDKKDFNEKLGLVDNDDFFVGDKTKSIWYPKRPLLFRRNEGRLFNCS